MFQFHVTPPGHLRAPQRDRGWQPSPAPLAQPRMAGVDGAASNIRAPRLQPRPAAKAG